MNPCQIIIILFSIIFSVKNSEARSSGYPSSSCGNLTNIKCPFTLSSNSSFCLTTTKISIFKPTFQLNLACEDNNHTTVIYPYFGGSLKGYKVEEIDYIRNKMRVVDGSLNKTDYIANTSHLGHSRLLRISGKFVVAFLNCDEPVHSHVYLSIEGMLLMEIAGKRRNMDALVNNISQVYFLSWVHDQLVNGIEIEMGETVREREREMVRKLILVALWCIKTNPSDRPSMNRVVEMLEGSIEALEMPPKPNSHYPIVNEGVNEYR